MRSIARSHPWSWMVVAGWLLSVALGVREVGAVCPWAPNQHAIDETNRCYQIKLQWDNVANATQYNIYKRPHDGSDPPINQWTYVGYTYSTPFTLLTSSLPAGEAWKFKIAAVNSNDTSCQPGGVPLAVSNM